MKNIVAITIDFVIFLGICLVLSILSFSVYADNFTNGTMRVEVDLVDFTPPPAYVGIQVPDHVYMGNLSKKTMETDDVKVYINNTGNVNVIITPMLKNSNEEIFSYLFFQRRTTVPWQILGNWSLNISAPDGKPYEDEYFYMKLDLADYSKNITQDRIGHYADIVFYAMPE